MGINLRLRHQSEDRVIGQRYNLIDFMRCAETIKEMNKRNSAFQRSNLRNQRKILSFLYAAGAQHGAARLPNGHYVRMVAKDRQCMSGNGASSNVQHKWRQLTGQFVQRRDHQQQTLR